MSLNQKKYEHKHENILRDTRPLSQRFANNMRSPVISSMIFIGMAIATYVVPWILAFADLLVLMGIFYFIWLVTRERGIVFKLPLGAKHKDPNNMGPGKKGQAEGIMYLGNSENGNEEIWFSNSDARTHVLYLGTTGAGKTEGLKSMVTNAMAWGSGFVYVDGKADTDLWSSLSSLCRRFGRDDDLLVLNYMTGNSDVAAPSNTMNPFSSGSASYLVNMLVSLMPDSEGDNAMWKERAVSLIGSMMPALTWKRDNQEMPLSVRTIRDGLSLPAVIKLERDDAVPAEIRAGLSGYLDTLPGFIPEAFDDEGKIKPPDGGGPPPDTTTASQQHGYLAMQFTRSLQSLGDDYGYIFDTQAADVDMVDVVLNRRILVVLIPALEKSGDEIANLGKIVASTIKGMMGSALGSTVEGDSATVIENKPTHSATPFMTIFDEVGYYTAQGMAVMAAQARSLGFCLVFSGQDLPAMKKRVREEANSITANCNIKIFGKLEDPTETKDFFEKTVGSAMVTEVSGFQMSGGSEFGSYSDTQQASVQLRPRASYDGLRGFKEGQAVVTFGETVIDAAIFYSNPGFAKAMRVTRYMSLPQPDEKIMKHANAITKLRDRMVHKSWTAIRADVAVETPPEIDALARGFGVGDSSNREKVFAGMTALVEVYGLENDIAAAAPKPAAEATITDTGGSTSGGQGSSSGGSASGSGSGGGSPFSPLAARKPGSESAGSSPLTQKVASSPLSPLAKRPQDQTQPVSSTPENPARQSNTQKAQASPLSSPLAKPKGTGSEQKASVSPFAAAKKKDDTQAQTPMVQAPQSKTTESQTPKKSDTPSSEPVQKSGGSPLSFFGGGDKSGSDTQNASAPSKSDLVSPNTIPQSQPAQDERAAVAPAKVASPLSGVVKPVTESKEIDPAQAEGDKAPAFQQAPQKTLDKDVEIILDKASKDARKYLFKDDD